MAWSLKSRAVSRTIAHHIQNCIPIAHLKLCCDASSLILPTWERWDCRLSLGTHLTLIGYSLKKRLDPIICRRASWTYNQRPSSVHVLSHVCALFGVWWPIWSYPVDFYYQVLFQDQEMLAFHSFLTFISVKKKVDALFFFCVPQLCSEEDWWFCFLMPLFSLFFSKKNSKPFYVCI